VGEEEGGDSGTCDGQEERVIDERVVIAVVTGVERWQPGFLDFVRQTTSDFARNDNIGKRTEIARAAAKEAPRLK
jgi:hypothetical protein